MRLAFSTGALAAGIAAAVIVGVLTWLIGLVAGWADPWPTAGWLVLAAGLLAAGGAYVAEWVAYRRTLARMRAIGEPWAYRERDAD